MAADSTNSSKGFGKVFHKKIFRTKEKVLHSLGKADRTQDEVFDEHVTNFGGQQAAASKLQKELKNYINCVKAMQNASNNFYNAIKENYEDEWTGYTEIVSAIEQLSFLWEDYAQRLQSEVMDPMSIYLSRFPDVRTKISKRGRKLVDYDSTRHNLQALEMAKKRDDMKVAKAMDDLNEAEHIYNAINTELHNEIPSMFDSRINFLASNFTAFFTVESKFQEESAKVKTAMSTTSDELQRESHTGILNTPRPAKMRNGALDEDNVVDLSRNELSPVSSPLGKPTSGSGGSRSSKDSGSDYRQHRGKNSDSASQSSASGHNTPVPKPRDSVHMYHNDPAEDEQQNTQVQSAPKAPEEGEHAYEDYNYDDGSYEAIAVRNQLRNLELGIDFDSFGRYQPQSRPQQGVFWPCITEPGPEDLPANQKPGPAPVTKDNNDNTKHNTNEQDKDIDDDEDEDDEQVYKVPTCNEPVNDNIPFGVNVLYKDSHEDTKKSEIMDQSQNLSWSSNSSFSSPSSGTTTDITTASLKAYKVPNNQPFLKSEIEQTSISSGFEIEKSGEISFSSENISVSVPVISPSPTPPAPTPSPANWDAMFADQQRQFMISTPSPTPQKMRGNTSSPMSVQSRVDSSPALSRDSPALSCDTPSIKAAEQELAAIFDKVTDHSPKRPPPPTKPRKFISKSTTNLGISFTDLEVSSQDKRTSMPSVFGDFEGSIDPFEEDNAKVFDSTIDGSFDKKHDPFAGEDPFANEDPSPLTVPSDFQNVIPPMNDPFAALNSSHSDSPNSNVDPFAPQHSASFQSSSHQQSFDPFTSENAFEDNFSTQSNLDLFSNSGTSGDLFNQNLAANVGNTNPDIRPPSTFQDEMIQSPRSANADITVTGLDSSCSSEIMEILKTGSKQNLNRKTESNLTSNSKVKPDSVHDPIPIITVQKHDNPDLNLNLDPMVHSTEKGNLDSISSDVMGNLDSANTTNSKSSVLDSGQVVLYRVQATHAYQGEDTDELTFEGGETICVVPWDDPEEQDDGWLYGYKESDGEKGVFPANFTKKL